MTTSVQPAREAEALGLLTDGRGPVVGPVVFAGVRFWAAIELDDREIARRRVGGSGALHGDAELQEHLAAKRPAAVQLLGCLVNEGDAARSLRKASLLAGYASRSILVDEHADVVAVTVDAALLDQGVVVCRGHGRFEIVATPGPPVVVGELDRRELALREAVYSAWLTAGADAVGGSVVTARR